MERSTFVSLAIASLLPVTLLLNWHREATKLRHIPTVGYGWPILTYLTSFRYLFHAKDYLQEGYDRYKGGAYKVATLNRWVVFVSGQKQIDELRRAPEDVLSFTEASTELLQIIFTMGETIATNTYHIPIVRTQLTRNLGTLFPEIHDEFSAAFSDLVDKNLVGDSWTKFNPIELITTIVCRASNRAFVGLPLCRDPDYIDLNGNFSLQVTLKTAQLLLLFPRPIRPYLSKFFAKNLSNCVKRGEKHVLPLMEEHKKNIELLGPDYPDKPNNFFTWMMDKAEGEERSLENLTKRLMVMNFSSVHSTSMIFVHALYQLASMPEIIEPLRQEVEKVVEEEGWSKQSMSKMVKLDSFLHENQRFQGIGHVSLLRKAMKPFTFSDGTHIPVGTTVNAPAVAIQTDEEYYPKAKTFDPFRFVSPNGTTTTHKWRSVTTSNKYLVFGHGHHACPGRFFAALKLKLMLAHIVLNYDVKLESGTTKPEDFHFCECRAPNLHAGVLLRKRQR